MDTEWAWAAGIYEGEGCVYARLNANGRRYPCLFVRMTDEDVVRHFHRAVGVGNVRGPIRHGKPAHYKPLWEWTAAKRRDLALVAAMFWPYLGERRKGQILAAFAVMVEPIEPVQRAG